MTAAAVARAPEALATKNSGEREFIDALEAALVEKVQHYLASCVYDNARFLAERLVAHVRLYADHNCAACCGASTH